MHFKIQVVIEEESGQSTLEDIVELNKGLDHKNTVGLSLLESKQLLQSLQRTIVLHQAASYSKAQQDCPCCQKKRRIKGHHTIQFRSLFGIVAIPSLGSVALSVFRPNRSLISLKNNCRELLNATEPSMISLNATEPFFYRYGKSFFTQKIELTFFHIFSKA